MDTNWQLCHQATKLSNVERHLAAVHQGVRHSCGSCAYSASKADLLRRHLAKHHALGLKEVRRKISPPGRQKRPPNAYLLYCRDMRGQVRRDLETEEDRQVQSAVGAAEVSRALAKRWRALTDQENTEYQKRYSALMDDFRQKNSRSSSVETGPESRTAPRTPFQVYTRAVFSAVRSELPKNTTSREIFRELGRLWRKLTPEQKEPYVTACWAAKMSAADNVEHGGLQSSSL